jgi:hypothetical protein
VAVTHAGIIASVHAPSNVVATVGTLAAAKQVGITDSDITRVSIVATLGIIVAVGTQFGITVCVQLFVSVIVGTLLAVRQVGIVDSVHALVIETIGTRACA